MPIHFDRRILPMAKQKKNKKEQSKRNHWLGFSRVALTILVLCAAFSGICTIGAHFTSVPWGWITLGIIALIVAVVVVWYVGNQSREPQVIVVPEHDKQPDSNYPVEEYEAADEE